MPTSKKFKRAVRARMDKTGESYAAARAKLDESTVRSEGSTTRVFLKPATLDPAAMERMIVELRARFAIDHAAIERACDELAAGLHESTTIVCRVAASTFFARGSAIAQVEQRLYEGGLMRSLEVTEVLDGEQLFYFRRIGSAYAQLALAFDPARTPAEVVRLRADRAVNAIEAAFPR